MLQGIFFSILASQTFAFRIQQAALKQGAKADAQIADATSIAEKYDPKDGMPSHPVAWQAEGYNEVLQWDGMKKVSSWSEVAMKDGPYSTSNVVVMLPNRANLKILSESGEYVRARWLNKDGPNKEGFVKRVNVAQKSWFKRQWKASKGGRKTAWNATASAGNSAYNGAAYVGSATYKAGVASQPYVKQAGKSMYNGAAYVGDATYKAGVATHKYLTDKEYTVHPGKLIKWSRCQQSGTRFNCAGTAEECIAKAGKECSKDAGCSAFTVKVSGAGGARYLLFRGATCIDNNVLAGPSWNLYRKQPKGAETALLEAQMSVDESVKHDAKIDAQDTDAILEEYNPKDGRPSHPVAWQAEGYNEVLQWNGMKKVSSWSEVAMKDGPYATSNVVVMLPNRANLKILSESGEYVRARWLNKDGPSKEGFVKRVNVAQKSWFKRQWKAGKGGRKIAWDATASAGNAVYKGAAYVGSATYKAGVASQPYVKRAGKAMYKGAVYVGNAAYKAGVATHKYLTDKEYAVYPGKLIKWSRCQQSGTRFNCAGTTEECIAKAGKECSRDEGCSAFTVKVSGAGGARYLLFRGATCIDNNVLAGPSWNLYRKNPKTAAEPQQPQQPQQTQQPQQPQAMQQPAQTAGGCQNSNGVTGYTFSHNGYWTQGYKNQGRVGSAKGCADKCDKFSGCVGFHFNPNNSDCNVYTKLGVKGTSRSQAYTKCSQGWYR